MRIRGKSNDNSPEISMLAALARSAEADRLTSAARARVLRQAMKPAVVPFWGVPGMALKSLAAAAVFVLLLAPAAMLEQAGPDGPPAAATRDLNLQVSLNQDGSVLLEWDNGKTVHTVKRATSAAQLAKVSGIRVEGDRFVDPSAATAELVYYQVD